MASYSLKMPEWLVFLRMTCAFAEGAAELVANIQQTPDAAAAAAAACVAAALQDPHRRVAVVGGREGMPRSLGSIYGGSITRFLSGFRGVTTRTIATPSVECFINGLAVSRDGSALLIPDNNYGRHAIHVFSVHTAAHVQTIGGFGHGPLQFWNPCHVWVASDGFVFVADCLNARVQILTPQFDFHCFVGVRQLLTPTSVCANSDVIVVSESGKDRLSVFQRSTGELLRRFGSTGRDDDELTYPCGCCFMPGHRHFAVADSGNNRVSVWTLKGKFVRHVGVDELKTCINVACSDADELVVAERDRIVMFDASGEIVWTSGAPAAGKFTGVAVHGSTIFGQTSRGKCVVFK